MPTLQSLLLCTDFWELLDSIRFLQLMHLLGYQDPLVPIDKLIVQSVYSLVLALLFLARYILEPFETLLLRQLTASRFSRLSLPL